jgi:hypothetical protein
MAIRPISLSVCMLARGCYSVSGSVLQHSDGGEGRGCGTERRRRGRYEKGGCGDGMGRA